MTATEQLAVLAGFVVLVAYAVWMTARWADRGNTITEQHTDIECLRLSKESAEAEAEELRVTVGELGAALRTTQAQLAFLVVDQVDQGVLDG